MPDTEGPVQEPTRKPILDVAGNRWSAAPLGSGVLLSCKGHGAPMTADAARALAHKLLEAADGKQ